MISVPGSTRGIFVDWSARTRELTRSYPIPAVLALLKGCWTLNHSGNFRQAVKCGLGPSGTARSPLHTKLSTAHERPPLSDIGNA